MISDDDIIARLPGDLKRIAEIIGVKPTLKLARELRSIWVYIHSVDDLEREIRDKQIREEFDLLTTTKGLTARAAVDRLAIKHALSTRWVWTILGREPEEPTPLPLLDLLK